MDEIVHFEHTEQEHIVVICGGNYYHVPVTDRHCKYISSLDLENQFEWIKADAKHSDGKFVYHMISSAKLWKSLTANPKFQVSTAVQRVEYLKRSVQKLAAGM